MNWAHVHLALNHVPVIGVVFVFLLLIAGLAKKSAEIQKLALQGFVILTLVSIPIKFTGDFASENPPAGMKWDQALVEAHEETSDQATAGIFLLGLAAAVGLFAGRKKSVLPKWSVVLCLVLGLVTIVLMVRTAQAGGRISHPEVRAS